MRLLLDAVNTTYADDGPLLVFGASQSARLIGMALNSGALTADPDNLRFVALAPPTCPHGIFQSAWHDLMTQLFGEKATEPLPTLPT